MNACTHEHFDKLAPVRPLYLQETALVKILCMACVDATVFPTVYIMELQIIEDAVLFNCSNVN